ncbi:hypothetical protein QAD02_023530 [Eretmocerus hayati]|uniref:Uncharacterized protein n=1 Tax=Eretmocerus hayati TaxID=131215 RepID=A0ACC2PXT8_9HYME|nr:hypothetical protein QAD02_023530 [Eretmocerus hayati]
MAKLPRTCRYLAFSSWLLSPKVNVWDNPEIDKEGIYKVDENLTGFQRLRNLLRPYRDHPVHPDLLQVLHTFLTSFLIGGISGGIKSSRNAFIQFIENNEATQFLNHIDAKRQLNDKMFMSFMKGFMKLGSRVSFFCTTFVTTYVILTTYQNRDCLWFYPVGGMVTGAIYKFPLGPKGMFSGAFFGGMFGSVYTGMKYFLLRLSHISEEELRGVRYGLIESKNEAVHQSQKRLMFNKEREALEEILKSPKL